MGQPDSLVLDTTMTHAQRNAAIAAQLKAYTAANTVTKQAARNALIREGFLTSDGKAAPLYRSKKVKAKT